MRRLRNKFLILLICIPVLLRIMVIYNDLKSSTEFSKIIPRSNTELFEPNNSTDKKKLLKWRNQQKIDAEKVEPKSENLHASIVEEENKKSKQSNVKTVAKSYPKTAEKTRMI